MLRVLVTNIKGGCGKTTIATNLAAAFAAGGFATGLAEVDRQRSSLTWLKLRGDAGPSDRGPGLAQGGGCGPAGAAPAGDRRAGQPAHAPCRRADRRGGPGRGAGAGLGVRRGQHRALPGQARGAQADPQGPQERGAGRQPPAPALQGRPAPRTRSCSGWASRWWPGSATGRSMASSRSRASACSTWTAIWCARCARSGGHS